MSEKITEANKGDLNFLMLECGMTLDRIGEEWERRPEGCTWADFMAAIRDLHARGDLLVPPGEDVRLAVAKPTLVRACDVAYEPPPLDDSPLSPAGQGDADTGGCGDRENSLCLRYRCPCLHRPAYFGYSHRNARQCTDPLGGG